MYSQRMSRRGRSLATSGKMSSDSPDTATVSSRMKRPRGGMAPITSPPTMKTFAVLAGCRPKISTMSSRVTQMPRYLPMRSMAGSFDDGAAGGRRRLGPLVLALLLGRGLAADGQHVLFQLDLHLVGLDPRQLGAQLDGVAVVAHLHAWHTDHAAIALGGAGGKHGVEQRRAEEVTLHALEQRVQHRERILVLARRHAALAAIAGFRHPGRLALVLTLALLVGHGRLLSMMHRWRGRPVGRSTSHRGQYRRRPVSRGPEEVAHHPTDGTSRRSAIGTVTAHRQCARSRGGDVPANRAGRAAYGNDVSFTRDSRGLRRWPATGRRSTHGPARATPCSAHDHLWIYERISSQRRPHYLRWRANGEGVAHRPVSRIERHHPRIRPRSWSHAENPSGGGQADPAPPAARQSTARTRHSTNGGPRPAVVEGAVESRPPSHA